MWRRSLACRVPLARHMVKVLEGGAIFSAGQHAKFQGACSFTREEHSMCGIVAYTGNQPAKEILIEGLKRLEYRGYDSSGIFIANGAPYLARAVGKVAELERQVWDSAPAGMAGIAHTRWATHGKPSVLNAHPHADCSGKIYLVHNGIIENYLLLKKRLLEAGHQFKSETDTEVLAHLVEANYQGDLQAAVQKALLQVQGTFGIGVMHVDHKDSIVVARRGSPIILGIGEKVGRWRPRTHPLLPSTRTRWFFSRTMRLRTCNRGSSPSPRSTTAP